MAFSEIICLISLLVSNSIALRSYRGDQVISTVAHTKSQLNYLHRLETSLDLDFWSEIESIGQNVDIHVKADTVDRVKRDLSSIDLEYNISVSDLQSLVDKEKDVQLNPNNNSNQADVLRSYVTHPVMDHWLERMASECGDRCTLINIGQSFEGREMKVIKITSNSSTGNKSAVFVEGGAHAREWISPVFVNNLIYKLIIEYGVDSSVTLMLDNYDWYILPLVNPDGYQYSHDSERYWRKNRATTIFRDCVGVDLNRNFPSFGMSDPVYSKHPCEDTYGGPFPGSERETKNLVKFLLGVDKLHVFLSFHSYSKMILIPWSHKMKPTTHHSALKTAGMAAANAMEAANGGKWVVGLAGELLSYNAAGTSLDWAYANTEAKFVFTFEMPPSRSPPGFVLPESSIKSVVDTTWPGVTTLIKTIINTPALEDKYFVSKGSSKGKDMCYCELIFMLLFTFCYI